MTCTAPRRDTATWFVHALFSKEVCLYAGADWLSSSVSQRVVKGQLDHVTLYVPSPFALDISFCRNVFAVWEQVGADQVRSRVLIAVTLNADSGSKLYAHIISSNTNTQRLVFTAFCCRKRQLFFFTRQGPKCVWNECVGCNSRVTKRSPFRKLHLSDSAQNV